MLMLGFVSSSCNHRDKLSENYLETKKSIDLVVQQLYLVQMSKYERLEMGLRRMSYSEIDTIRKNRCQELIFALKEEINVLQKEMQLIDDVDGKMSDAREINKWIAKEFQNFKDAQMIRIKNFNTIMNSFRVPISTFESKWNNDFHCLDNVQDLSLAKLNLSKLKLDLLLMNMDAFSVYMSNWHFEFGVYPYPQIVIADEKIIPQKSKYKANVIFGVFVSRAVDEIVVNELYVNKKRQNFNKRLKVSSVSNFEMEVKDAGEYKYKGYVKYKSPEGDEFVPFEKSFVVE